MEIDEAIKKLTWVTHQRIFPFDSDENKACELGIEALKWIKWRREYYKKPTILALPGETEK